MKSPAIDRLRRKRKAREAAYGIWCTMESSVIVELAVTLGLDWVTVDLEHGHLDWHEVMDHVRAARGSETAVFVRVPELSQSSIKRALDIGAHGVILPLIRTRAELELAMRHARYPVGGLRGVGGERAVKWGLAFRDYVEEADAETLIIPMIETREAAEQIDDLLSVPGLEMIFFGPADLSASYGYLGDWEGPGMAGLILDLRARAAHREIGSGIITMDPADACRRRDEGFNMIGLGSDAGLIIRSINTALGALGVSPARHLWF